MSSSLDLAFLHADACSYGAAMARADASTVDRLQQSRNLFEQLCREHGGRVVDKVGDSMLLAFEQVEAAYEVASRVMTGIRQSRSLPEEQQIFEHRIGITSGRVMLRDGTLYGHTINTAARIGSLVRKGSIGIDVRSWSKVGKLAVGLKSSQRRVFAKPDEPFVDFVEVMTDPHSSSFLQPQLHDRNEPIVAIIQDLPDLSGGQGRLIGSLIDALHWEFGSYFSNQGWRTLPVVSTAVNLITTKAADYTVRCGATTLPSGVRIYASLSSPYLTRGILTFSRESESLEGGVAQVLALVSLVGAAVSQSEYDRAFNKHSAGVHQLVAAGRSAIASFSSEKFSVGMELLKTAQQLEPDYPLLLSSLARAHAIAWRFGWAVDGTDKLELAQALGAKAHQLEPNDARCEADLAFVKFWSNNPLDSVWHYERSLEVLPYHAELAADAGMVLGYVGQNQKAAKILERSVANIPNDVDYRLWSLGDVYHSQREYQKSLDWLLRMKDQRQAQRLLVANKVRLGLDPSRHVANVLAMQPDFSVRRWVSIQPFMDELDKLDFEEALLEAGLPH